MLDTFKSIFHQSNIRQNASSGFISLKQGGIVSEFGSHSTTRASPQVKQHLTIFAQYLVEAGFLPTANRAAWCAAKLPLSDACDTSRALFKLLLLFLDVLLFLVLLLFALHLAEGRADLPLHALDAQLALVR